MLCNTFIIVNVRVALYNVSDMS